MMKNRLSSLIFALVCIISLFCASAFAEEDAAQEEMALEVEAELPDDETCLGCHFDEDIEAVSKRGKTLKLFVKENALEGSVHEGMSCTDCHGGAKDFEDIPHNEGKPLEFLCADCHDGVVGEYHQSVHGAAFKKGDEQAAQCKDCHGGHNILPASHEKSKVNKFNLSKTCGACHDDGPMLDTHKIGEPKAVGHYLDSIHGRALFVHGLVVAPTCNDCHGVHDILPKENPDSKISFKHVAETCGECHKGIWDVYKKSIHGQLLLADKDEGPNCVTCHTSHEIELPTEAAFRLSIDRKCGECHGEMLERYRESFHGKAIALGRAGVAACHDCHGHHDILPEENEASHISEQNKLETCKRCHEDANPNFANYLVHSDHTDKELNPIVYWVSFFMTGILLGTFAFFAIHTLLWLVRSIALYLRDPKKFKAQKVEVRKDDEQYIRFKPIDRFLHGLVIFSFLLLVITGMPLKFYYTEWARWLLDIMGGQAVAAVLHRFGAIITIFYFLTHVLYVTYQLIKNRERVFKDETNGKYTFKSVLGALFSPDSPMPSLQDVRDFIAHQKWFFGKGEKPQFDRWTYWEKFDYFAVFWGVFMIGLSGLIMWFPEFFTTFLPGWIINVAMVIHSDEALLAAGFIFTFHFFNVHFRPEKFPMDPVIFSGRISRAELEHERGRLLQRWEESGQLEEKKVKDEWHHWQWILLPAGAIAFLIGVALVIGIYTAMYTRLMAG